MQNMPDLHLHIISFDIPWPANYGGVIDVFYKAKALSEKGVKVHLHCFQYGRKPNPFLENMFHKFYFNNFFRFLQPFPGERCGGRDRSGRFVLCDSVHLEKSLNLWLRSPGCRRHKLSLKYLVLVLDLLLFG